MGGRTQVLVVDDDDAVREALLRTLRFEGYAVLGAGDGQQALDALADGGIDAVVMDVLMPVLDGVVTCRAMRAAGDCTPVVLLTARDGVRDRVAGLDAGADDYLTKPFALEELLARLRAVLRRAPLGPVTEEETPAMGFADLELDPVTRRVARSGRHLVLTRTEFALLECFLRRPGQVLTREVLFEQVWGQDFGSSSNSLDVYIGYLRRKTEEGDGTRLLHTVRGVGFVLRAA